MQKTNDKYNSYKLYKRKEKRRGGSLKMATFQGAINQETILAATADKNIQKKNDFFPSLVNVPQKRRRTKEVKAGNMFGAGVRASIRFNHIKK